MLEPRYEPRYAHSDSGATPDVKALGAYNALSVLELVRVLGPISRAELARQTSFKSAALTGLVRYLIDEGLVIESEVPREGSKAGRPARALRINASSQKILAIDLEPDHLRLAVCDLDGAMLNYRQTAMDRRREPKHALALIEALAREMGVTAAPSQTIAGVGVSCAGLLDERRGILLGSTNLPQWRNVPIRERLEGLFGVPVQIGRSIHQAAWAEHWFREQNQSGRALVVTLRTGIGSALLANGTIYRGRDGFDGELGHTLIDLNGDLCECGRRGCLETFLSPASITRRVREKIKQGKAKDLQALQALLIGDEEVDPERVYRMARDGSTACKEIVSDLVNYLGIGIANLVNLLNPDRVILSGAIEMVNEDLISELKGVVLRQCLPQSGKDLEIASSRHAERSALLGAAAAAAQFYFNSAIINRTEESPQ